jgi:hypothetical protein
MSEYRSHHTILEIRQQTADLHQQKNTYSTETIDKQFTTTSCNSYSIQVCSYRGLSTYPSFLSSVPVHITLGTYLSPCLTTAKPFPLLLLPTEIRLIILAYCLCSSSAVDISAVRKSDHIISLSAHVLRTSRQIYYEGTELLYRCNTFGSFDCLSCMSQSFDDIGTARTSMISALAMDSEMTV